MNPRTPSDWRPPIRGATLTATLRHPASLRPSLHFHVQSFGRFDEILCLVEKDIRPHPPGLRPLPPQRFAIPASLRPAATSLW
jgi:hypothetical protein